MDGGRESSMGREAYFPAPLSNWYVYNYMSGCCDGIRMYFAEHMGTKIFAEECIMAYFTAYE